MSVADAFARPLPDLGPDAEMSACCAALYEHPAVRWLLGGELHPGGEALTRHALEAIGLGPTDRLLDVASGAGSSALVAAGEFGAEAVGVDLGEDAVAGAREAAAERGLGDRASFVRGDAERLPFPDAAFTAALSECSLCTFADKPRAAAELRRVLAPGGRLALSDVVADPGLLEGPFRGPAARIACVGEALAPGGHERLLAEAGFGSIELEDHSDEAAVLAERVHDRLRGARLLGADRAITIEGGIEAAISLVAEGREAIADGRLRYILVTAQT